MGRNTVLRKHTILIAHHRNIPHNSRGKKDSAHPASTYRSSTPPPLMAYPHPSLPHTLHNTKMRRWCLSPRSPRSPSSQQSASANDLVPAPSESTSAEALRPQVVDESNVVLLILNARDPAGCRSRLVEEELCRREAEGKRLVFVLNKIGTCVSPQHTSCASLAIDIMLCAVRLCLLVDLLPRENAQACLNHLRHTTPTLPFHSAGSHQRTNLASGIAPASSRPTN